MDGKAFEASISQVLAPRLEPGTVVILDNLATHKNLQAAEALKKRAAGSCSCRLIRKPRRGDR